MALRQQRDMCSRSPAPTAGVLALGLVLIASQAALATDYPLEASALVMKDSGVRQRFRLVTAPSALELPASLPAATGATVEIRNPSTGESAALPVPSGDGWSSNDAGTAYSYVGRFIGGEPAPVRVLRMKQGSRLKLVMRSTVISLNEDNQRRLSVVLSLGGNRYCVACDAPAKDQLGTFIASKCSAPAACPTSQIPTTTTSTPSTTTLPGGDASAPSVPSGVIASTASCSSIDVRWNASSDSGGSGLKAYNLYRNNALVKQVMAPATTTSDTSLSASTTFYYQVAAVDNAGNQSSKSGLVNAATSACVTPTTSTSSSTTTTTSRPTTTSTSTSTTTTLRPTTSSTSSTTSTTVRPTTSSTSSSTSTTVKPTTSSTSSTTTRPTTSSTSTSSSTTTTIRSTTTSSSSSSTSSTVRPTTTSTSSSPSTTVPTTSSTSSSTSTTVRPTTSSTSSSTSTTVRPTTSSTSSTSSTTVRPTTTSTSTSTSTTIRPTTTSTSSSTSTSIRPTTTSTSTTTSTTSTTRDTIAPSVPTGPSAAAVSCSQINVAWNGSTDSGGSGLAGYRVYRNNSFLKQVATTNASDTGLAASTVYSYQVSAVDFANNESPRSAIASSNTPACTVGGAYLWAKQMGGAVLADAVVPYDVAVDRSGNVFVTGVFYGTVNFGTGKVTSAGGGDMFVAKYSAAGVPQWVRDFGDAADQFGTAVATDSTGNVYVTGYFFGTVDFGGGPLVADAYDVVLAKYSATGAYAWAKRIGGASYEMGQAIAVDASSNVIVAGQFAATVDFGGGPLTSAGGYDGFIAKYTTAGVHVWSKRVGGPSLDTVTGLGVDDTGNPTAVGYFQGTSSFGGANLTSAGSNDVFVARYSAAGAHQWSKRFGDAADQRAYGAAVDGAGNVALTGYFNGMVSFGGATFTNAGGADIFLAKLDATGAHAWSKAFGTSLALGEIGKAVAIDGQGNVILTGDMVENVDVGGGALNAPTITYDVFAAKYSPAGDHLWSKRFAQEWDDHGNGVAVDASGNVVVVGDFYQSEDFGGGLMSSPGGSDGFVTKLGP